MLKKLTLMTGLAAAIACFGYAVMAATVVLRADTPTVLRFAASERVPLLPQVIAHWRVHAWQACPVMGRDANAIGATLRGYGLEGFDDRRVLATATHLIELGCDIDQRSPTGHTALHEAILYNESDVVRFLLSHGADPAVTIEVPAAAAAMRRPFAGLDSVRFAEALQVKSSHAEDRRAILQMLRAGAAG